MWILDTRRGIPTRVTSGAGAKAFPVWSPTADRFAFGFSPNSATVNLYAASVSNPADARPLVTNGDVSIPTDWSHDGSTVLYTARDQRGNFDIWAYSLDRSTAFPVVQSPFQEDGAHFSPDGRWVAYETSESGRVDVVVQAFPSGTGKVAVSSGGGSQVRWSRDGRELYYLSPDGFFNAAPFEAAGDRARIGTPTRLFRIALPAYGRAEYAVARDGRFLVDVVADEEPSPLRIVLNWRGRAW